MKKRILSLLLTLCLVAGLLPGVALAEGAAGDITVTVTMNTQSVADDVTIVGLDALPASTQVTVPAGSTVAEVMSKWAADTSVSVSGLDRGFISAIGAFDSYNTAAFTALCEGFGLDPVPDIFRYAGWSFYINNAMGSEGISSSTVASGDTVAFRYGVYMTSGTWEQVDFTFLDAYNRVATLITTASAANESDYTAEQWETVQNALTKATSVKTAVDTEEPDASETPYAGAGMWLNYFAAKGTSLWVPSSVTDRLQSAGMELSNALDKIPTPEKVTVKDGSLVIKLPLNGTYQIQSTVLPEGAPQDVTYEAGGNYCTVSDTGIITPQSTSSFCMVQVHCKSNPSLSAVFMFSIVDAVDLDAALTAAEAQLTWDSLSTEPADAVTTGFSLPSSLAVSGGNVAVDWSLDPAYGAMGISSDNGALSTYVDRPASVDASCTLTATLSFWGSTRTVTFPVTVKAEGISDDKESVVDYKSLMDGIAAGYTSSSDAWVVLDMAAYGQNVKPESGYTYSSDAPSALADLALGVTPTTLDALKSFDSTGAYAIYTTPYVLLAYDAAKLDDTGLTNTRAAMKASLVSYLENISTNYAGVDEVSPILCALAPYYHGGDAALDAAVDAAIAWLSAQQQSDGTFAYYGTNNANSTAFAVIALSAYGIDAHADSRFIKNNKSAVEGLMSFALASLDGFGYKGNVTKNALATEQGFRALVAYARMKEAGSAYNIYLDAAVGKDAPADPKITATTPPAPVTPVGNITVSFSLTGDSVHGTAAHTAYETWIAPRSVTVTSGSSVGDVFRRVLAETGYTAVGADTGYVSSITTPAGVTLAALSNGDNSGWMYRVSGEIPSVGLNDYILKNGEKIEWFYVDDWKTLYPEDGSDADRFLDIASSLYRTDILWAAEKGLMNGVSATEFAPERAITRGQAAAVLYRLAGSPASAGESFSDVREGSYCAPAAAWAAKCGVALGFADGTFRPGAPVSRQQLAVMLYRAAKVLGYDTTEGGMAIREYSDYDAISDYAKPAMAWCVNAGLLSGENGRIDPAGAVTRAEAAAVLHRLCGDAK